jgi:hypothetical protein
MLANKAAMQHLWTWAGLQPAIAPPIGGRIHRMPDEPLRKIVVRGAKSPDAKWGNQYTVDPHCVLCGRKTRNALQVRISKSTSRNHRCCLDCQYRVSQQYSRKTLLKKVRDAVMARMANNDATPPTVA